MERFNRQLRQDKVALRGFLASRTSIQMVIWLWLVALAVVACFGR
jgi:hypothetical protein